MSSETAVIKAVCISEKKGEQKHPVPEILLVPKIGIPGDAHAGDWHRQVSLLGAESVRSLQERISIPLFPGAFAVGTKLRVGSAVCVVTQIGKECHADCAIRQQAGDCVMPREGIFVRVLEEGSAKAGDLVSLLPAD